MLKTLGIITAVLAAGLLVWLTWSDGGGDADRSGIAVDPANLPERFDPDRPTREGQLGRIGASEGAWVVRLDPETRRPLQEFRAERHTPRADFEFDVVQPEIRLYLAPHRVIHMTAAEGRVVAPGDVPQQGYFSGGVVISIYHTDPGTPIDISPSSPDLAARILLEDATFNTLLRKVDSDGAVRVVWRDGDFAGTGLSLVYNEPQQRLDYLLVREGRKLRYRSKPGDSAEGAEPGLLRMPTGDALPAEPSTRPQPPASDDRRSAPLPVDYYRVTFESAVRVVSAERTIDAAKLTGYFGFAPRETKEDPEPSMETRCRAPRAALAATDDPAADAALAEAMRRAGPRLFDPDRVAADDLLVMTWSGPMEMQPVDRKPRRLQHERDLHLLFEGSPVRATGADDAELTCAGLEYVASMREVAANGTPLHPLRIVSPRLGVLEGDDLVMRLDEGRGALWGAGSIQPAADAGDEAGPLPPGFSIRWTNYVELELAREGEAEGLRSASFHGGVAVDEPRFALRSDELDVNLTADEPGGDRQLASIEARGEVAASAEQGKLWAERMRLQLKPDPAGKAVPDRLEAEGRVVLADTKQKLRAGRLDVQFLDPADMPAAAAAEPPSGRFGEGELQIGQVRATEQVRLALADGTRVEAVTLIAHGRQGVADLAGSPEQPVAVFRDEAELHVARLHVEERAGLARAEGTGRFDFHRPATELEPARRLSVTWTESMRFDERQGRLDVAGDVVARESSKPAEQNRLEAGRLRLDLVRSGDDPSDDPAADPLGDQAMLKRLVARDNVVLLSTRWTDASRDQLATRLRISGPTLTFDNLLETARVDGPGSMLIEDRRPADRQPAGDAVDITGRGVTLFTWTGRMVLEGPSTDATFVGEMQMTHRPAGGGGVIDLQADRLVADMVGLDGMEALETVEQVTIDHIEATGRVQVRDGRKHVLADSLYYDGAAESVVLQGSEAQPVKLIDLAEGKPVLADRILWNLPQNEWRVTKPRY